MTLKEELEILRGEPIQVFTGDPMDIPCIETSDPERLCRHPVVSVCMITYNHESFIRQAIDGVMMQKTDFEFELVIGEDASQDKTREVCFEYQKRYPDKVRVLWWHENVSKLGGNGRRTRAHCRGEFIALCEGDDYWIDPLKLQKQVDVMRAHQEVGLCFCRSSSLNMKTGEETVFEQEFKSGLIAGLNFVRNVTYGVSPESLSMTTVRTATALYRKNAFQEAKRQFDILDWRLLLGDTTLWLSLASCSDVFYLWDIVSCYRANVPGSLMSRNRCKVLRDAWIVRAYFAIVSCHDDYSHFGVHLIERLEDAFFARLASERSFKQMVDAYQLLQAKSFAKAITIKGWIRFLLALMGCYGPITLGCWRKAKGLFK